MAAYLAETQVDPGVSGLHAILATFRARANIFDLIEMLAFLAHLIPRTIGVSGLIVGRSAVKIVAQSPAALRS